MFTRGQKKTQEAGDETLMELKSSYTAVFAQG